MVTGLVASSFVSLVVASVATASPLSIRELVQQSSLVFCPAACSCADQGTVDCEARDLDHWPAALMLPGGGQVTGVNLHANHLTGVPSRALAAFPRLEWLFLSDNEIMSLPENMLEHNRKLLGMWLDNNQLRSLPPGIFRHQSQLNILSLAGNQLRTIAPGTFDHLSSVEILDLSNNRLRSLSIDTFKGMKNLMSLNLEGNIVNCSLIFELLQRIPDVQYTLSECSNDIIGL